MNSYTLFKYVLLISLINLDSLTETKRPSFITFLGRVKNKYFLALVIAT